jgi:hypothetical protein
MYEDHFDSYIARFENFATLRKWDRRREWALQLSLLLTGKALEAYDGLPIEQQGNYDDVKAALLRRYAFTEEEFRKQFYSLQPDNHETVTQFGVRIKRLLTRWLDCTGIQSTFDDLKDLLVREQILRRCHQDLAAFLRERKFGSVDELSKAAELYIDAHGGNMKDPKGKRKPSGGVGRSKVTEGTSKQTDKNDKVCKYCKRSGHDVSECWRVPGPDGKKKCFRCGQDDHLVANCPNNSSSSSLSANVSQVNTNIRGLKEHFSTGKVNGKNAVVFRDHGSNVVVVRASLVLDHQLTGDTIECRLTDSSIHSCPVAKIDVVTEYLVGPIEAAVMPNPLSDIMIGNVKELKSGVDAVHVDEKSEFEQMDVDSLQNDSAEMGLMLPTTKNGSNDVPPSGDGVNLQRLKRKFLRKAKRLRGKMEIVAEQVAGSQSLIVGSNGVADGVSEFGEARIGIKAPMNGGTGTYVALADKGKVHPNEQSEVYPIVLEDCRITGFTEGRGLAAAVTRSQSKKPLSLLYVPDQELVSSDELKQEQTSDSSLKCYWRFADDGSVKETKRARTTYEVRNGVLFRLHKNLVSGETLK